ncbi:unnamed protein product [Protopolystoma xenopodis]|uniref:Uncharacterized protein n=1 Tax=Protopolystoma xenopodis TaxID=117903 RepID=A0A3S5AJS1_9PLAT|nr:unnamed protein product [Protopolystoma xenopodis]
MLLATSYTLPDGEARVSPLLVPERLHQPGLRVAFFPFNISHSDFTPGAPCASLKLKTWEDIAGRLRVSVKDGIGLVIWRETSDSSHSITTSEVAPIKSSEGLSLGIWRLAGLMGQNLYEIYTADGVPSGTPIK